MSSLLQRVYHQAKKTFDRTNTPLFKTNFTLLKQLVDQLVASDLQIDKELYSAQTFARPQKAPCTFVDIYENDDVSISIFILAPGYTMPLHDHPMMYGILKAISGTLMVQSYTAIDQLRNPHIQYGQTIKANMEPLKELTPKSDSAVLSPNECNYHEIQAVNGPAAFFDVLSPPYEADIPTHGPRCCSFYKKTVGEAANSVVLEKIRTPFTYYCDNAFYQPDFLIDDDVVKE